MNYNQKTIKEDIMEFCEDIVVIHQLKTRYKYTLKKSEKYFWWILNK